MFRSYGAVFLIFIGITKVSSFRDFFCHRINGCLPHGGKKKSPRNPCNPMMFLCDNAISPFLKFAPFSTSPNFPIFHSSITSTVKQSNSPNSQAIKQY